ncbi:hypothetical protein CPC08DRAFT_822323 [Agrocybe pediades]|nr:hypothetical protein CPC08DRAFT_822323 [Agrocybe pediades]
MNQETREAIKNDSSTALAGAELRVKRWIQLTRPVLNWAVVQALAIPETPERIHTHLLCVTVHPNFSVDAFPKKDKEILRAYKVQSAVVQGIREFRDAAKPDLQTGIDEVLNHLRSRGAPSHYPDSLGVALVAIVIPAMRMTRVVPFGVEGPANELPPVFPDWEAELTRRINEDTGIAVKGTPRTWKDPKSICAELQETAPSMMQKSSLARLARELKQCQHCFKSDTDDKKLLACAKCKRSYYCNRDCQMGNWPEHKSICKMIQESDEALKANPGGGPSLVDVNKKISKWLQLSRSFLGWASLHALTLTTTPERLRTHLLCIKLESKFPWDALPTKTRELRRAFRVQDTAVCRITHFRACLAPEHLHTLDMALELVKDKNRVLTDPDSMGFTIVALYFFAPPSTHLMRVLPYGLNFSALKLAPYNPDWEGELRRQIDQGKVFTQAIESQ